MEPTNSYGPAFALLLTLLLVVSALLTVLGKGRQSTPAESSTREEHQDHPETRNFPTFSKGDEYSVY